MKKSSLITIVIITSFIIALIIMATYMSNNFHARTAMITEINEENNIITMTCGNGNMFEVSMEIEDFMVGDLCSMIMYDYGTEYVDDDKVVSVWYEGYLGLFELYEV